jgi:hypothetical protein
MRVAFCTVATKPKIALARVTARSFAAFHPEVPFFCLLADKNDGFLTDTSEPFKIVYLAELEIARRERLCFRYDAQELTFACAPLILEHLLELGYETVCFVKQESMFFGPCAGVIDFCARHSVTLCASHIEPVRAEDGSTRELTTLLSGVYNGGFVSVTNCTEARAFLAWWTERLSEYCYRDVSAGLHFDQRWLDLVPSYFPGFGVVREPGFNIGHWCLPDRRIEMNGGVATADGEPCSLVRFSGYDFDDPDRVTVYFDRLTVPDLGDAALFFRSYHAALQAEGFPRTRNWPFAYGFFSNAVPVPLIARRLYAGIEDWTAFGDPFDAEPPHSLFRWLNSCGEPSAGAGPRISRLWRAVYASRPDVRATFGEIDGEGATEYLRWAETQGLREHDISPAFLGG